MEDCRVVTKVNVNKCTINDLFIHYVKNELYVNRRYQRKLVWDIYDKKLLIDSVIRGIPLPALLLSEYVEKEGTVIEIADGMQRIETIISFMLGEFSVRYDGEDCFFDPYAHPDTFNLVMDKKLEPRQNVKFLPRDICIDFYRSEIPVIVTNKDEKAIELIFSRINSTGKKISSQDLRQSKAIGEFSDLVRRVACRIRGDYTYSDRICLCDMKGISVGQKEYGYGVDINTVFWRRHDLITNSAMKESKDEEIIESLIATVLLRDKFRKSKDSLDSLYNVYSAQGKLIESKVNSYDKKELEDKFTQVFNVIDNIFSSVDSNFTDWVFDGQKNVRNKDECFKVLYLALCRLLEEHFVIDDYKDVAELIHNANNVFYKITTPAKVDYDEVRKQTENVYTLLKGHMVPKIAVEAVSEVEKEIDKRLKYSTIERQMTEFKIAVSNHTNNKLSAHCMERIEKTLVAMANVEDPSEIGMVIIGIADTREAYTEWREVYHENADLVEQHYVPGVSAEAQKLYGSADQYLRSITQSLSTSKISNKLKEFVLQHMELVNYHDKEVLVLYSSNVGEESLYDNEKWIRHSNMTVRSI